MNEDLQNNQNENTEENRYDFTYGSGAGNIPTQTVYTSSYGTSYRPDVVIEQKPKKHFPGWLKVTLGGAAFGLIAAAIFILSTTFYNRLNATDVPAVVNEDSAANRNSLSGTPVSKNKDVPTVPSTDVLDGNVSVVTDVSDVVENSMPAIVQINCTFNTQSFFGTYESAGAGSGIIIRQSDTELLIATNNHVVENATSVEVTFDDDTKAEAYVKGTDAYADLAVVAVDLKNIEDDTFKKIKVAALGNSDDVKVGQMAIAIGNALGYGTSVTVGYISAIDREVEVDGRNMTLLQTDAAINPGNSGGALLNVNGEVIGINSVKYSSSSVEGMGFAIPISRAVNILDQLANREKLKDSEKGYLGIQMQTVTSEFADAYNWPTGVYVSKVVEGSPAEDAGILAGDIITEINGITVKTGTDLRNEITSYRTGTKVTLVIQRMERGRFSEITVEATLTTNPDYTD